MPNEWEQYLGFRDRIAEVLDQNLHPIQWLDAVVFSGLVRVFAHGDSCILTETKTYPSGVQEVHGLVAVGDKATIAKVLVPQAEQWGRTHGCQLSSVSSRPGWAKALDGYAVHQVTVRKEL